MMIDQTNCKIAFRFILLSSLVVIFLQSFRAYSQENIYIVPDTSSHAGKGRHNETNSEKFNPGDMIMEHIVDNHEWPVASIGGIHLTIPLPVILIYKGHLYTFWSSEFHNPDRSYKGFTISHEGADKGKIVTVRQAMTGKKDAVVYDFSITKTVLAILISGFLLILIFVNVANRYTRNKNQSPSGMQNLFETFIIFIRDDIAKSSIGEKKYEKYVPYLLTIFFFIFFNNLLGIVPIFPGGANVTGNIAVTGVMAAFTLIITTFNGNKHYWIDIINTPGVPLWLKLPVPLMPVVEFIGIITKPFVLMIRLFANMTAGHIIILGFISIIFIFGRMSAVLGIGIGIPTLLFMIFMDLLELLVAVIQAYVFTLLSALYFGLATAEPEHH
jgi:F-type H+-transporting ATPase subunit a